MLSHNFITRNNFYVANLFKIWFSDKNVIYLATVTTWVIGDQMIIFLVEMYVHNGKIVRNNELKYSFSFSVSQTIAMATMYTASLKVL